MKKLFTSLFLLATLETFYLRKLPSYIQKCKYTSNGEKLSECLLNTFNKQRYLFLHGVPELQIPNLDPMVIDHVNLNTGNGTAVSLNAYFSNITVYGGADADIRKLRIDVDKGTAEINTFFPRMSINCHYNMRGKILIIQLNGDGKAEGNFTNVHSSNQLKGEFIKKKNKTYINWNKSDIELEIGAASLYFHDLFKGNPQLTATTNHVINENALVIINDMKNILQETISSVTFTIMNRVFKLYSVEELFD